MVEESARIAPAPAPITVASISVVDDLSDFPESGAADSPDNVTDGEPGFLVCRGSNSIFPQPTSKRKVYIKRVVSQE